MNKLSILQKFSAFSHLADEHLVLLADRLGVQIFKRGETIFHQGSSGSTLYIIVSGQVRIYTINEAGQERSVIIFRAGEFFGELALLDGLSRSASATAMYATKTLTLDRRDFLDTVSVCPPIAIAVLEALAVRLRNSTTYAENLTSSSAPQRVMRQLVLMATHFGTQHQDVMNIEIRLTQDELASLAGTTRETVNRVLSSLRDQGVIQVERACIRILNLPQLQHSVAIC